MLYSRNSTLEDRLVQLLLRGASTVKDLHIEVLSSGNLVSLRAVYKTLSLLIEAGVLFKVGKRVWINEQWARSLREHLLPSLPPLASGERIAYTFTSLQHLDVFWKTIAFQFEEYERDGQMFFYNPHNFWAYIPELKESEDDYYAHFAKAKKHAFFTVGGTTLADKEFKRLYQNDFFQIDARAVPSLGRRDHITILDDFVITARLSDALAKQLDEMYAKDKSIETLMPLVLTAYRKNTSVRLTFEHNAAKAKRIRTILSTNFYIQST